MNEQINLKELPTERLKAAAYDISRQRDHLNRTLMVIEKELQDREVAEQQAQMATQGAKATNGQTAPEQKEPDPTPETAPL